MAKNQVGHRLPKLYEKRRVGNSQTISPTLSSVCKTEVEPDEIAETDISR